MDVGPRRIIAECRFATVTDRDIHFYRHQNDVGIQEALRLREVASIRCEYQQRPFLAAMFVVLAVACIALAVRTLLAGGPALSTTVASVGGRRSECFAFGLRFGNRASFASSQSRRMEPNTELALPRHGMPARRKPSSPPFNRGWAGTNTWGHVITASALATALLMSESHAQVQVETQVQIRHERWGDSTFGAHFPRGYAVLIGGESGIRTHGAHRSAVFKTAAFNRSATSPSMTGMTRDSGSLGNS